MAKAKKTSYHGLNNEFTAIDPDTGTEYTYSQGSADSLVMWTRMSEIKPTDLGPNNITSVYEVGTDETTAAVTNEFIGHKQYPAASFNDALNKSVIVSANSALSFSSLSDGGTPSATSDQPFTVSFWVKVANFSPDQHLFGKSAGGDKYEYRAYLNSEYTITPGQIGHIQEQQWLLHCRQIPGIILHLHTHHQVMVP